MPRIRLAPWQLALAAAAFITLADNAGLFAEIAGLLDPLSARGLGFLLGIGSLILLVLTALFAGLGIGRLLKPLIAVTLIATATFGYFSSSMGVVFDEDMLLNMADTVIDRNAAEATELASLPLFVHVLLFGVLPSLMLAFVELRPRGALGELASRLATVGACAALFGLTVLPNYRFFTFFAVEHRDLRFRVMPVFPVLSMVRLVQDQFDEPPPFTVIDDDAVRTVTAPRRAVGIMVVGETARADHFSLGGYERQTNPMLERVDGLEFFRASACGTSTRFSVPCMFSLRGRDQYSPDVAQYESNVLDVLTAAGVRTVWIDNNSSCKHVCERIDSENLRRSVDTESPYYSDAGYMDEILLDKIDAYLGSEGPDTLVVLHTLGSHGPAYSRRYPERFGRFAPYCDKPSPTECSASDVVNAYDNTIVYTDYLLGRLIDKLQARGDELDTFLFYASDHGESLGEGGIYLHGLPYAVAPQAQTEVPMAVWLSPGYRADNGIGQVRRPAADAMPSHDNISHTLLGLFNVDAGHYREDLDLFGHRRPASSMATARPGRTAGGGSVGAAARAGGG